MPSAKRHIYDNVNARGAALTVLLDVTAHRKKSGEALKSFFAGSGAGLDKTDRAFVTRLVNGTLSRMVTIDGILGRYLRKPLKTNNPVLAGILRLSVYQILYMDKVPDYAAVDEGVRLTRDFGLSAFSGLTNAVLRNVVREKDNYAPGSEFYADDSLKYSLPGWIVDLLKEEYGTGYKTVAGKLLAERNVTLRFNLSGTDAADPEDFIRKSIENEGFSIDRIDPGLIISENNAPVPKGRLPVLYELTGGGNISESGAFSAGLISVQDPASALVAAYAAPVCGDYIIDVAAAPGGKAIALADMVGSDALIDARDISAGRIGLIIDEIRRTGLTCISVSIRDALIEDTESLGRADIVIADLPCSCMGVIAKRPDIKLNLVPGDIDELCLLQRRILSVVSAYVKPGGRLIYSTCTVTGKENEQNARWISDELGFELVSAARFDPGIHNDGFFIAVLTKVFDGREG